MRTPRSKGLALAVALAVGAASAPVAADDRSPEVVLRQGWMRKHPGGYALSRRPVPGFDDVRLYSKMFFDFGPVFVGAEVGRRKVMAPADDDSGRDLFADVSAAVFRARRWPALSPDARVQLARRWVAAGEPDGVSVQTGADDPAHALQVRQDGDDVVISVWLDTSRRTGHGLRQAIAVQPTTLRIDPYGGVVITRPP